MPNQRTRQKRKAKEGLAKLVAEPIEDSNAFRTGKGHNATDAPDTSNPKPDTSKPGPSGSNERPVLDPPAGFKSKEDYKAFRDRLNNGLKDAGYGDGRPILQGSATDGFSHNPSKPPNTPFDGGSKPSDYDIAIESPSLVDAAKQNGVGTRSGGTRTGPLSRSELRDLGLLDLRNDLSKMAGGRKVDFMAYQDGQFAVDRASGPSISMKPPYGHVPKT
jgi:hypothetical protein